ncbi:MAG TPA: Crp/Fnr family transcriptional regulator [Allosphingosinicella sp.]|jgi:CRP-like cAMP-binding protein|nr:Crp/Fnr family transcriptional regulator [Allosphingosinicella sp.]
MSNLSPLLPMLRKLEYWGALGPSDRGALLALPHTLRTIEPRQHIVREGDVATRSCVLRSGFAFRHKIVGGGRRQILAIHMKGDLIDLQNSLLGFADHSVQALTVAEVALIPREAIVKLAFDRPAIGIALWKDTLVDGSIFREWVANVGRRDARTRLAHLLCEFALRLEATGEGELTRWELPMTQEHLGDCTGLTSVHINRTLKGLERDELISRSSRSVTIEDWKRLAQAGDFQSDYLHLGEAQLTITQ